jgi:hypothetical protein
MDDREPVQPAAGGARVRKGRQAAGLPVFAVARAPRDSASRPRPTLTDNWTLAVERFSRDAAPAGDPRHLARDIVYRLTARLESAERGIGTDGGDAQGG